MDKFDRVQQLHRLLCSHRFPIPINKIASELECSSKTAKNIINLLRDQLNAPLYYDEQTKGWQYDKQSGAFELPGLWLTAEELLGMVAILNILHTMDQGLLGNEINVVKCQVEKLLAAKGINTNYFTHKIKYLSTLKRPVTNRYFLLITDALLHQKQLMITYSDYKCKITQRVISPQTLVHYQENWYLDAWCHKREALRSFMLVRITKVIKHNDASQIIPQEELKNHFQSSYGIFAGQAKHQAELMFYPPVAQEVAGIRWHPEQQTKWDEQYFYVSFPYNDDRELVREILKYGNKVEVIKPAALKNKIISTASDIVSLYCQ